MEEEKLIQLISDEKVADIIESKDHLNLAKFLGRELCGFTPDDEKYVDIFWDAAFNKSWLYVTEEIVNEQFGYKKGKQMMSDFYRKLNDQFDESIDYKQVTKEHELVKNYYGNFRSKKETRGGGLKKFYIITGETYKSLLQSAHTEKSRETLKYHDKIEKLVHAVNTAYHLFELKKSMILRNSNEQVASSVFDSINHAFAFGSKNFRTIIINDEIWFCGKDIAGILGYSNERDGIRNHVDDDDKGILKNLLEMGGVHGSAAKNFTNNELNAIFINESGLYSLILRSDLPNAKQFKSYVTKTLLPSIRKLGQEKYLQQLRERDEQIKKLESKQLKLESFVKNIKPLDKNQFFYIATTPNYARQNRFEYGGIKSAKDLKPRLATYNTGQPEGNLYYYAKLFKCNNYRLIEERIGNILQQFKDKADSRKEMVYLRYNLLEEVVDYICNNYDKEIEDINSKCQQFLSETIELDSIVPDPVDLGNFIKITVNKNGVAQSKKINITGWSDEKINKKIEEIINLCAKEKNVEYNYSKQKDLTELELTWGSVTTCLDSFIGLTKTAWRDKFREWFSKEKPKKLNIKGLKLQRE